MNGLQRRTTPAVELSGVAVTTSLALAIQRVSVAAALRLTATTTFRLDPYFMYRCRLAGNNLIK